MSRCASCLAGPVLVAGLCISGAALADTHRIVSDQIAELAAGLFCAPADGGRRPAPGTISGWMHVPYEPIEMVVETQRAPAVLGVGFGLRYTLSSTSAARVHYTLTHPPIPPQGITQQTWSSDVSAGLVETMFFQFDHADELQVGDWSFRATLDGVELFDVGFTVEPAQALPALASICQAGSLLSFSQRTPAAAG